MEPGGEQAAVVSHCALQTSEASIKLLGQKCPRGHGSHTTHPIPQVLVYVEREGKWREAKKRWNLRNQTLPLGLKAVRNTEYLLPQSY